MSNISNVNSEKRLQLVKQIRSKYREDQRDLTNRELILYGKSTRPAADDFYMQETPANTEQISFFRIRVVFAALLFAAVIFMDMGDRKIAGITAERIFQAISADYEAIIDTLAYN